MKNGFIRGIVHKVIDGKHGFYAVATADEVDGSITFSLDKTCWEEQNLPENGIVVALSRLRRKRAGWRALNARFLCLDDERKELENEKKSKKQIGKDS